MKVRAIRTDSWLGIKAGEVYSTKVFKGSYGERLMVSTDGYSVLFNERDFEVVAE